MPKPSSLPLSGMYQMPYAPRACALGAIMVADSAAMNKQQTSFFIGTTSCAGVYGPASKGVNLDFAFAAAARMKE